MLQQFSVRSQLPLKHYGLWKIEAGAVRTQTWLEDGTLVTLGFWGPGEVVGRVLSRVDPYQIECLTKVEATLLALDEQAQMTSLLLDHMQQAEELMVIRSYRRVDSMLIRLLGWLAKKFGRAIAAGNLIDLRLTHQDIADTLGTTRVTITRLLGKLEEQGLIQRYSPNRIVLREEEFWHYEI
jgi:CRP-like cAMP-binding protein